MLKISDLNILNPLKVENCSQETVLTGAHFDSRRCQAGYLYIALKGQNNDGHDFIAAALANGAVLAVVDKEYQNRDNYPVIYADCVELFFAQAANLWRKRSTAIVIGVTGTNGKTSTKEMLKQVLSVKYRTLVTEGNFNNQLGVPLTLFCIQPETEVAVIEMGTNHFGEIAFLAETAAPDLGLITNIGEGHLEELGDLEGVLKEKIAIFEYLKKHDGLFLVNNEDKMLAGYDYSSARISRYGMHKGCDFYLDSYGTTDNGLGCFSANGNNVVLGSLGTTGCKNALAALAVGAQLQIPVSDMCQSLGGFGAASKRGEILQIKGTRIVVDCYNANPSSMREAVVNVLNNGAEKTMLILGDMLEMGQAANRVHRELGELLKKSGYGRVLLFGTEMDFCARELKNDPKVTYCGTDFALLSQIFGAEFKNYNQLLIKGSRGMRLERLVENISGDAK